MSACGLSMNTLYNLPNVVRSGPNFNFTLKGTPEPGVSFARQMCKNLDLRIFVNQGKPCSQS
jgi:hypothetical protein